MAEDKKDGFVVSDRRKFTVEGELREESADDSRETPPAATAMPPSAPVQTAAAPEEAEPMPPPPTEEEQAGQHEQYKKGSQQLDDLLNARGHAPAARAQLEVSFAAFIESLYMSALIQLGAIRPEGEQPRVDIIGARQTIDTLGMLQEKTKGNLTPEEERLLQSALFELRMAFVEVTNALNKAATQPPPGANPIRK
jgi:hypothetical protein